MACENRWSYAKNFLTYLGLHFMDPISQEPSRKLQLEEYENQFDDTKDLIHQSSLLTVQEIEKWIEVPNASIGHIQLFIKEWKKIEKEDISSQICKTKIQFRNANFQEVNHIVDLFSKWCSGLVQS